MIGLGVIPPIAAMAVVYGRYMKTVAKNTQVKPGIFMNLHKDLYVQRLSPV
jgi:hypothetical protein